MDIGRWITTVKVRGEGYQGQCHRENFGTRESGRGAAGDTGGRGGFQTRAQGAGKARVRRSRLRELRARRKLQRVGPRGERRGLEEPQGEGANQMGAARVTVARYGTMGCRRAPETHGETKMEMAGSEFGRASRKEKACVDVAGGCCWVFLGVGVWQGAGRAGVAAEKGLRTRVEARKTCGTSKTILCRSARNMLPTAF